jgi:N-acetylmuramoyl-L-alanine amidase
MPAVQVEMAYLTNPEQARDAAGDEFRNRIAQALFQSVARLVTGQESRTP